jgi:hypothetical protein
MNMETRFVSAETARLQVTATRLANQKPTDSPRGEYLDLAVRVLVGATRLPPACVRDRLDEIAGATNADETLSPNRPVTSIDVARVWLQSLAAFPALTPAEQRRAVATSLWKRAIASWPMRPARC